MRAGLGTIDFSVFFGIIPMAASDVSFARVL
jgi:hypothetical protein